MLELVDRISLSFIDFIINVQVVFRIIKNKNFYKYKKERPIRPMVKTVLFQCTYKGSSPLWVDIEIYYKLRGYSLIGKTAILHIVILGSIPNISIELEKLNWLSETLKMSRL